jgi:predicted nucleic acid-binding protein
VNRSSLYLDTSCLLKLFFLEPESAQVAAILAAESRVVVSELVVVEASVQIQERRLTGLLSKAAAERLETVLDSTLGMSPFEVVPFAASALAMARSQVRAARKGAHCRTLDRLHLAVMQTEQMQRLFTNDDRQAKAARQLGFEVLRLT